MINVDTVVSLVARRAELLARLNLANELARLKRTTQWIELSTFNAGKGTITIIPSVPVLII